MTAHQSMIPLVEEYLAHRLSVAALFPGVRRSDYQIESGWRRPVSAGERDYVRGE